MATCSTCSNNEPRQEGEQEAPPPSALRHDGLTETDQLMVPLMAKPSSSSSSSSDATPPPSATPADDTASAQVRSRGVSPPTSTMISARGSSCTNPNATTTTSKTRHLIKFPPVWRHCGNSNVVSRYMNVLARLLFWSSLVALSAGVVWYSYELTKHGTDPHLIAWFSAGAFVLLGFPISMYGIVMHLANYNQPNVQCYVVRILWMVPIYSMESWLCLRFHRYAIYIETLRDCYESYVLYCFLQFLIQVLGGQDELIQILRTKSPTRGVHMWGLQWCVRPWLMGVPVSKQMANGQKYMVVTWTSPFFVKCKFGVLQYVLLKFVLSIFVMSLELNGLYKEGDFTPTGGYLYICILTNLSQCWALYCLIFFYYATKNELSPIQPVGKFMSVKALVFFTWWQSVGISILYQMDMIPHYQAKEEWTSEDVAKGLQDYLICIEMFLASIVHVFVFSHTDYLSPLTRTRRASMRHHHQQTKRLGRKYHYRNSSKYPWKGGGGGGAGGGDDQSSKNSASYEYDLELASQEGKSTGDTASSLVASGGPGVLSKASSRDSQDGGGLIVEPGSASSAGVVGPTIRQLQEGFSGGGEEIQPAAPTLRDDNLLDEEEEGDYESLQQQPQKKGFVSAWLDSTIPRDVIDSSVSLVKGEYHVEKKTLLHHATTSDQYDLFRASRFATKKQSQPPPPPSNDVV